MATYLDLMFRDTIAGSMLRTLMLKRAMPQREYMRLYHVRCGRADAPTKSTFGNNFGRYVSREETWDAVTVDGKRNWTERHSPLGCIAWHRPITARDSSERWHRLEWTGPTDVRDLLKLASDKRVTEIENTLERITTGESRIGTLNAELGVSSDALVLLQDVRIHMRTRSETGTPKAT